MLLHVAAAGAVVPVSWMLGLSMQALLAFQRYTATVRALAAVIRMLQC